MSIYGPIDSTGGSVNLNAQSGPIQIGYPGANPPPAPVTASGTLVVNAGTGGITQVTVAPLTAGGNIALASSDVVNLNAPIVSNAGAVSITGYNVSVSAPITAATSIAVTATGPDSIEDDSPAIMLFYGSLTAGGPIQINATAPGSVLLADPVSTGGPVSISGSTITISAPLDAGTTVGIDATAGLTTSGTGTITSTGNIDIASTGTVTISPPIVSAGNVSVTSGTAVVITDPITAGAGFEILAAAPVVDIYAQLTVPGNLPQRQLGGPVNVLVQANTLTMGTIINTFNSIGSILAPGGIIAFTPYTQGFPLTVDNGGVASIGPVITPNDLGRLQTIGLVGGTSVTGSLYLGGVGSGMTPVAGTTTLNISTDLTPFASTLGLFATGLVSENPTGIITAGTLVGGANSAALTSGNSVGSLGSFTSSAGFALADTVPLAIIGPVTDPTSIALTDTGGAITEALGGGGSLTTGLLTGSSTSSAQFANTNAVTRLGSFAATGGFTLVNTGPLTVSGPVTGGPRVDITDTAVVKLTGPMTATVVGLTATGSALTETGAGVINAGTLFGRAHSATLGKLNTVGTLDTFKTTSGFLLDDSTGLDIAGLVSAPSATVSLTANGALTESSGSIDAATLAGSATSASLGNANTVGTLGTFTTTSGFLLNDTTGLEIAGLVSAPSGTVSLVTNGALTETGGRIDAGTLAGSATSAQLTNGNTIGTLGSFSAPDGLTLDDVQSLLVTGPVDPSSIAITDTQSITLAGNVSASNVSLIAQNGGIGQTAGTLTAGTLTGRAATGAQFGGISPGVALVGTLGSFSVGSGSFVLADSESLTVAGPLSAPYFQVVAPGQITLANATITTTGVPIGAQGGGTPAAPGSFFQVTPLGGVGSFVQTGVATIQGLDGTQATVRIDVPGAAAILLADLAAPGADIVLASPAGSLLGNLFADNLLVIGTFGSSNLFGSIRGVTTPAAAALGQIEPAVNRAYLFNGCVIASPTCGGAPGHVGDLPTTSTLLLPSLSIANLNVVLSNTVPPTMQPNGSNTQNVQLYLAFPPTLPGDSNPEIVLPNVSGRDY